MTKQLICFVLLVQISLFQSEICLGWNDTQKKCLPCVSGYYGINCSSECSFPLYGMNCMSNCNCSENDCNRVYGCLMSNEANGTLPDGMDGSVTVISKREEEPLEINGVVYSIIGLVATSVLFIILYLCTHILEKC
uniref:Uncharacterized protein n=1 Tax=Magallana gigas TaxID=29159 RepID=A0A8W8M824_MAGGI